MRDVHKRVRRSGPDITRDQNSAIDVGGHGDDCVIDGAAGDTEPCELVDQSTGPPRRQDDWSTEAFGDHCRGVDGSETSVTGKASEDRIRLQGGMRSQHRRSIPEPGRHGTVGGMILDDGRN